MFRKGAAGSGRPFFFIAIRIDFMEYFATSGRVPIHISDTKKGEKCILLLHGYLETLYIFNEFSEALQKRGFRVISLDLPGHGLSGSNPEINTMEFAAERVKEVMNICGVEKAYIAGHSMGGYVAQMCYKKFKERYKGLILLNSTPFADAPEKRSNREKEIELINNGKLLTLAALTIPKMYAEENLRRFDDKIEETVEICETHDPAGITASLRGMMEREDTCQTLYNAEKALLFFGNDDKFISNEKADLIASNCPESKIERLKSCGHNSFIECEKECADAIERFTEE